MGVFEVVLVGRGGTGGCVRVGWRVRDRGLGLGGWV